MEEWKQQRNILWLDQLSYDDVPLVGGKNASLGELYTQLTPEGINVPNGFVVTAHAYRAFIAATKLGELIERELDGFRGKDARALHRKGKKIRKAFLKEELPEALVADVRSAYHDLCNAYNDDDVDVAVRSSATAEDLPDASFAGEHETFLNVSGEDELMRKVRAAMASLFTDRAISYRIDKGIDHFDAALSVGVQKMVRSDKASSGVMFTLDTETGFRDVVEISSAWGLGEMAARGKVTPDQYLVFKPTLEEGYAPIVRKVCGAKKHKMIYRNTPGEPVKEVSTSKKERIQYALTDGEVLTLSRWAMRIEEHYSARAERDTPMNIEWAKDGESDQLFVVQACPETMHTQRAGYEMTDHALKEKGDVLAEGISIGAKIAAGKARVIESTKGTKDISAFKEGEVLVAETTDPDWEPIMKKAAAIVTERGGRTSHAAIVSRERGIPAVVGAPDAMRAIKSGQEVTVDAASEAVGKVYEGTLTWEEKTYNLKELPDIDTPLAVNAGDPERAFHYAQLPHKGVGLAREEFIIASHIGIHPLALIRYDEVEDKKVRAKIDARTEGYRDKRSFYVDRLARGIGSIAAAFWPHEVIVRFSDLKTNEYRTLIGGEYFEREEANPMVGWRGASRYIHSDFKDVFRLEVEAMKRVRERFGLSNVHAMVPFCRTPEEGKKVLRLMKEYGLPQGSHDLKVYMTCEIPTNVLRAHAFLDVFDGFVIEANDLAEMTLGVDRDAPRVAGIADENDPSVRQMISEAVQACKERGRYIGFCGQAPSDSPAFFQFLMARDLDMISLDPDAFIPMTLKAAEIEHASSGDNESMSEGPNEQ